MTLRRFLIERAIPQVGSFEREQLREAASQSNDVLRQLGPDIQWIESYVADDKTFCVYLAKDVRLRPATLAAMYPCLPRFQELRVRVDPRGVMRSDMARRLGLCAEDTR